MKKIISVSIKLSAVLSVVHYLEKMAGEMEGSDILVLSVRKLLSGKDLLFTLKHFSIFIGS